MDRSSCQTFVVWGCLSVFGVAASVSYARGRPQNLERLQDSPFQHALADHEAQLADALRAIEADFAEVAITERPSSRSKKAKLIQGAINFFRPFPGGNGRACATCHDPRDGFSLSPARAEARWQHLQRARPRNPDLTDPLFRPIDADDGAGDFTLLRTRALIKVRVPLPTRVRLTDDPLATHVTLSRAVTPLNMLKHTAPYQQDRSASTLEAQALAAVNQHMEPTAPPSQAFLESVAEFQRHIFSSAAVRKFSAALDRGGPLPDLDPQLTELEREGKEKFDNFCGQCHGGPAQVRNLENRIFPPFDGSTNPVSLNVVVSNPPPQGFPLSPIHGPGFDLATQWFTVDLPNGSSAVLESSDPGTVLTDAASLETVAGNQVFNRCVAQPTPVVPVPIVIRPPVPTPVHRARARELAAQRDFQSMVDVGPIDPDILVQPIWQGDVTVPAFEPAKRYRLVIVEYEEYLVDDTRWFDPVPTMKDRRVVFVEHIELN